MLLWLLRRFPDCQGIENVICFSGNGRTYYIDDSQCTDTVLLCFAECCQTVCCLTGLTDNDHKSVWIQDRVSVTEFRCKFYTYRNSGQVFNYILSCHSYMVRRAAGYNIDLADFADILFCKTYFCKINVIVFEYRIQSIMDCFRLFMNLFHHKVLKSGFLCCFWVFHGSSRCTPYGRTPLTELRTCGFPVSGSLRNESFTLSFVYIDIYPGSYQWIAVIQHI